MTMPIRDLGLVALCAACGASLAQPAAPADPAPQAIVVTGSVSAQRVLDAPFAVGVVDAQALSESGPMINLSEALGRVPGLVVANRNNYAQDLQISSRGFGARAGFGVRGLRLYSDGIPASMPDGQGQVAHFDLAGAERVEVLRGPFSVLYGNSSGGVIALFTAPARQASTELRADLGSFGLHQLRASAAAPLAGGLDLRASLSALELEGFRPHSAAQRQLANLRLGWQGGVDTLTLWLSHHAQKAQDPLGLSAAQFAADPNQTTVQASAFDTRKTISQSQAGLSWRHRFADATPLREFSISAHGGTRAVTQWLAIPQATQANARHGGGVIDFERDYGGAEARLRLGWSGAEVVLGLAVEEQDDQRLGFENFTGTGATLRQGVSGNLRRDERNRAGTRDGFALAAFDLTPALNASLGLRSGRLDVRVDDRYPVSVANIDDSGSMRFSYTNPVAGLRWTLQPGWTLHASAARGFESPTLGELAYGPGDSGFNRSLKGQTSHQIEFGSKWRSPGLDLDATLFAIQTEDEIGVFSNAGGRASFQNVGRTRRHGAELTGTWRADPALRLAWALSVLQAQYRDRFNTCAVAGCPTPTPTVSVESGNRIAGTQAGLAWTELAWRPGVLPGEFGLELRGQARTAANDTNQSFAPGCASLNLRWSQRWPLGPAGELQTLWRIDNLADRSCVGSVIVNDANGRFFEPAPPRNLLLSLRWTKPW